LNSDIANAIRDRRRLRFTYHGKPRLVEPQCYGIGHKGTELLRVHLIEGGNQPEPWFDVSKMDDLVVLGEGFSSPGPHYKRDDSAFREIFRQL
jgi:hypothetical protein